jgi:hypothetical protein
MTNPQSGEPAQVEERHREWAYKAEDIACGFGGALTEERIERLALAFAEQEREVRAATLEQAADALEMLERNMNYGPSLQDALLTLRALPQSGRSGSE